MQLTSLLVVIIITDLYLTRRLLLNNIIQIFIAIVHGVVTDPILVLFSLMIPTKPIGPIDTDVPFGIALVVVVLALVVDFLTLCVFSVQFALSSPG